MSKRFIACVLLLVLCVGGSAAYGEGESQLPAFSRATPEPTTPSGLPSFARPTPAAPSPAPAPNRAILVAEQGVQFEVTDVYFAAHPGKLQLKFEGVLTNDSGQVVRMQVRPAHDAEDGLFYSSITDKDAEGELRFEFPSGGVYEEAGFYLEADTAEGVERLRLAGQLDLVIEALDGGYGKMFAREVHVDDVAALSQTPDEFKDVLASGGRLGSKVMASGVRVEMKSAEIQEYGSATFLMLKLSGTSKSVACTIDLGCFRVDGIEAKQGTTGGSLHILEAGAQDEATVSLMATGADREAFRAAKQIEFFCFVEDRATRRVLFCLPVTLDTQGVQGAQSDIYYATLQKGDEGILVERLQRQLIALNYLFSDADGVYGAKTAAAVKEFCRNNALVPSEVADATVQRKLYGLAAVAADEPDFPLAFDKSATIRYFKEGGNKLKFRVEGVRNRSPKQSIKSFEVRAYAEDAHGNPIYGHGRYYYDTTTKTIASGKMADSVYLYLPDRNRIDALYVGIAKVTYSDGLEVEADPVEYWSWDFSGVF